MSKRPRRNHSPAFKAKVALAADAAAWVLALTPQQACSKAGMASKHFWLRKMLQ